MNSKPCNLNPSFKPKMLQSKYLPVQIWIVDTKDAWVGRPSDTLQSNPPPPQAKILQSNPPPQAEKISHYI